MDSGERATYRDPRDRVRCQRCGKVVYGSERDARYAAAGARARGEPVRAYREQACGYWHLTSRAARAGVLLAALASLAAIAAVAAALWLLASLAGLTDVPGGDAGPPLPAAASPAAAAPAPARTPAPTPSATPSPVPRRTPSPAPSPAPDPSTPPPPPAAWIVGNTGGDGVALRDDCDAAARFSAPGRGWAEGLRVEEIEAGSGRCAGWRRVEAGGVASWVREEYLVADEGG